MIYFIQAYPSGMVKIGTASRPIDRLQSLQTATHEALQILGTIPGDRNEEIALHEQFAEFRVRGEWFRPAERLMQEIRRLLNQPTSNREVVEWLIERFREQKEWPSDELRKLARDAGFSRSALWSEEVYRLPILKRVRVVEGGDGDRQWFWVWKAAVDLCRFVDTRPQRF